MARPTPPAPIESYLTIAGAVDAEGDKVKGARFVAHAIPIRAAHAEADRAAALAALQAADPDAAHVAWAYRIGPEPADFRWSDGGEPIGAAGRPILVRLDALQLLNVLVVVRRHAGGQRLAQGDLAKGYGDAARAVLAGAVITPFVPATALALRFDYTLSGAVDKVLAQFDATRASADYGVDVQLVVAVARARVAAFEVALGEATAGRVQVTRA